MLTFSQNILPGLNKRLAQEVVEPAWGWGFRVAIAVLLPLMIALYSNNSENLIWAVIGAETVSLIELKGSAGLRTRLLIAAFLFSIIFTIVGSLAGNFLWLSIVLMLLIAFVTGLMKSLGDWGLGLAISIYLYYLLAQAHPLPFGEKLLERCFSVAFGGIWGLIVGIFSFSFLPQGKPFRRTIAQIWHAVDELMQLLVSDWDHEGKKMRMRELYLKEQAVRNAINASLSLYENLYDEEKKEPESQKSLSYARRCASMASLQAITLADLSLQFLKKDRDPTIKVQMHGVLRIVQQLSERMSYFFFTKKNEELLLIQSRLNRLTEFKNQFSSSIYVDDHLFQQMMRAIDRFSQLVELSINRVANGKEQRIFSSYSFTQTLNILHPKYVNNNLKQILNADSLTFKYALRLAFTATLGLLIAHYLFPHNGYWLPFTIIIVSQPFFGATLKKGIERSFGTIMGVVVSSLILMLPFAEYLRLVLVIIGAVLMVYNLRKNYAWAAFFITLFLIGLLSSEHHLTGETMLIRILSTVVGAFLSILSAYIFFPLWDKKLLPNYFRKSVEANYDYFRFLFFRAPNEKRKWVQLKIAAETANSNSFDSLNRYQNEPSIDRKTDTAALYTFMTHNIRITRELNNIAVESSGLFEEKVGQKEKEESRTTFLLSNIYSAFQDVAQNLHLEKATSSLNMSEALNPHRNIDVQQLQYLEKLWLELSALRNGLRTKQTILQDVKD